ncbi:MAG: hypothetical protein ABJA89_10640 [Lapillicoccus sp.]
MDPQPDLPPHVGDDAADREVRDRLAAEPDPGPMPVDVEDRVVQALMRAGEIRLADRELFDELGLAEEPVDQPDDDVIVFPGVAPATEDDDPTDPTDPADRSERSDSGESVSVLRRRWPVLAAAAAVVALLAVAGANLFGQTRSGSDGLASIPGPSGQASPTVSVATAVAGRLHLQASGVAYTADTLASGARALVTTPGPEVGADQAAALGPLATTEGANACVAALGDADAPSVTVDLATYAGQPAAIIVIARQGKTTAYAVQRGCTTGDPEVIKDSVPVP